MNDRYTKLDRKPLGDAIEKLPKLDEGEASVKSLRPSVWLATWIFSDTKLRQHGHESETTKPRPAQEEGGCEGEGSRGQA